MNRKQEERHRRFVEEQQAIRMKQDLEFVQSPGRWPRLGMLPVVEREAKAGFGRRCGFITCWDKVEPVVVVGNMFDLADRLPPGQKAGFIKVDDLPHVRYVDFESLVAEWRVD